MTESGPAAGGVSGYGEGDLGAAVSVEQVAHESASLLEQEVPRERLAELAGGDEFLSVQGLVAGYGRMEILHGVDLQVGRGQSLCLIGPNGAGKSTVLHSIYGLTTITGGTVRKEGRDITRMPATDKLRAAGIAYILQDNSVFPDMTVEENLRMGAFLMRDKAAVRDAVAGVLDRYPRLAERRGQPARVLSGGERRLLEISRALVMDPDVLLVDEPSIGLEPRFIDMVFEILVDLRDNERKTIVMVEQNARKGLQFADLGYVLVAGNLALAGSGTDLLGDPRVGRLFLGG
jgi:branched-chain amino acid transport system ATP-binding protein